MSAGLLRPWDPADAGYLADSLARIADVQPWLRAFVHVETDLVVPSAGPLAGMPVAVKEIIDVAGQPVPLGSPLYAGRVPALDAEAVARLRAAGAVVVGTTTSTPFACGTTTATDNPHAPGHTPGGSSAGSGAAVGAGLVPVALASQSQASTIRPASYCGAWGFKPTHGRLPRSGMHLLADSLDDLGLIAASLTDLERVLRVLTDDWRTDVAAPAPLRLAVVRLDDGDLPAPALRTALAELVAGLAGPDVEVVSSEAVAELDTAIRGSGQTCFDIFAGESAATLAQHVADGEPDRRLAEMVAHATSLGAAGLAVAHAHRADLQARHAALAAEVDVLVTLSTTAPAPAGHAATGCRRMPATASLLGVPALSAPWLTVDGLPQGVQLLGFAGQDEELMTAASRLAAIREETP